MDKDVIVEGGSAGSATPAAAAPAAAAAAKPASAAPAAASAKGAGESGEGDGDASKPAGKQAEESPWTADWREKIAKGDESKAKRLGRYADPGAVADSLLQLQERISKGELRGQMPKDATPDQVAKWRADNGIPDAPDKYDLGAIKVAEQDKPIIDSFLKTAHGKNMTADQAQEAVKWYYDEVTRVTNARADNDAKAARVAEDALRADWDHPTYKANINSVKALLDTAPESVRENLSRGRLADGTPILAHADTIRYLVGLALEINPATTLDLPGGGSQADSIDSEIKSIEDRMRKDRKGYNADDKQQERYRKLFDAREKVGKR